MILKILTFISVIPQIICGKNVLFINLVPSPSHHIWNEALVEGLLEKQHNVTMIGFFPSEIKNYNYTILNVNVDPLEKTIHAILKDITDATSIKSILSMSTFIEKTCEYNLNSKEFQMLMDYPKNFFDMLMFDVTFSECYFPLIDHFGKPPTVGVTAFGLQSYLNDIVGERIENYIPFYAFPYTDQMSFFERLHSVFYTTIERLVRVSHLPKLNEINKNIFGENVRKIEELNRDISLIFSNDDPILSYPKPSSPNVIQIGGVHVKTPKKLDKDLQRLLDEANNGVIFVSLGSNFQPEQYSNYAKEAFAEVFSKLNFTILWKFDNVKVSENVIVRKWFSQSDVLAHPNIKLFVTHCGGLSSHETVIRGVPIVGIPLFHDQFYRCAKFKSVKGGVILDYKKLRSDDLYNSILEVLNNPEYKKNMMKLSNLYKTQPDKPLKKFLIWTDYLLQNGDVNHLSIAGRRMCWYERDNWDIFAFIAVLGILVIFCLKTACSSGVKKLFRGNSKKQKLN